MQGAFWRTMKCGAGIGRTWRCSASRRNFFLLMQSVGNERAPGVAVQDVAVTAGVSGRGAVCSAFYDPELYLGAPRALGTPDANPYFW